MKNIFRHCAEHSPDVALVPGFMYQLSYLIANGRFPMHWASSLLRISGEADAEKVIVGSPPLNGTHLRFLLAETGAIRHCGLHQDPLWSHDR